MNDRGDGVEEGQVLFAGQPADSLGQGRRGEGACGDDHAVPVGGGRAGHLFANDGDVGMGFQGLGDRGRKAIAVHGQGAARRHLVGVRLAQDQRTAAAHLRVQEPDGVIGPIVGPERVGTDQFGQVAALVGGGAAVRAHLVQHGVGAGLGDLPGGFAAGQAAANDMNGGVGHGAVIIPGGLGRKSEAASEAVLTTR